MSASYSKESKDLGKAKQGDVGLRRGKVVMSFTRTALWSFWVNALMRLFSIPESSRYLGMLF